MINQHNYNEILESKVFPWVNSKYAGAPYTFQQDWVPAHTAKLVQDLVQGEFVPLLGEGVVASPKP